MYFTIHIDKDEFDMTQEEFEFHERLINRFKSEYSYAFKYECSKAGNVEVEFNYFTETQKFKLIKISSLEHVHNRIISVYPKVKKWFN